jgi:hypothetical protein
MCLPPTLRVSLHVLHRLPSVYVVLKIWEDLENNQANFYIATIVLYIQIQYIATWLTLHGVTRGRPGRILYSYSLFPGIRNLQALRWHYNADELLKQHYGIQPWNKCNPVWTLSEGVYDEITVALQNVQTLEYVLHSIGIELYSMHWPTNRIAFTPK